jgi:hypothetical protein
MRSRASSFKWEYPLLSPRLSSNFLRLLPRFLVTFIRPFIFPSITCFRRQFLRKIWPIQLAFRFSLWDNVEKYGGDWGVTNDVTIWRMRVACWISKATCTYAHANASGHARTHKHVGLTFISFPRQQWFANAPQCYVTRTLSVLFVVISPIGTVVSTYKLLLSTGPLAKILYSFLVSPSE